MQIGKYLILTLFTLVSLLLSKSSQSSNTGDTSLYDWVAYNLLEDYVDILEMTAWFARRVKDNIDELVEESFEMLTKQQSMLQPALDLTDKYQRPDCAEGKIMNVTDAVFSEYFNMNINCPMIGQKMAVFFNELHNITERVAGIHRKHFNMSPGCGPPTLQTVDRNCLQNVINQCKKETSLIRDHMLNLEYDIEDFMDGQLEEASICTLTGMSHVRNVTKQAVQDIHCCLDIEEDYEVRRKYESPMLRAAMGDIMGRYDNIDISKEAKDRLTPKPFGQQYQPQPGVPQYHPPPPPHPGIHPQYGQPGMVPNYGQPGMVPTYGQPGMVPPGPHPGIHPQFQGQPGMHPHPPPHPGMQPQFVQHPPQQQGYKKPPPGYMQPKDPRQQDSKSPPPWRINPKNIPNFANRDGIIRDGSFEFDPSVFQSNQEDFGNMFGAENNDEGFDFNDEDFNNQFDRNYHDSL